jgi:hypothetical protein
MKPVERAERLRHRIESELGWGPHNCNGAIRAEFRCEYCGKDLLASLEDFYSWQIDHVTPGAGEDLDNIALARAVCSHLKHTYRPDGVSREERISNARAICPAAARN